MLSPPNPLELEELNTFKLHRIVIVSPNPEETDRAEAAFFEQNGFSVVSIRGWGFTDGYEMGLVDPKEIYSFCKSAWDIRAEGPFITCMDFNAVPITEALEADLKVATVIYHLAVTQRVGDILGYRQPALASKRVLNQ